MSVKSITFFDAEIDVNSNKILDIGAVKSSGEEFHSSDPAAFADFVHGSKYVCGHNILRHDLRYLEKEIASAGVEQIIDTLYLSPLLFPRKPYHNLVKDDKLATDELNNPLNDAKKARDLFFDEDTAFRHLSIEKQNIYLNLLSYTEQFQGFFKYIGDLPNQRIDTIALIFKTYYMKICSNASIEKLALKYPIELAYALALIDVIQYDSVTPAWVLKNHPRTENFLNHLRSINCSSCAYCLEFLDINKALKRFFDFDSFRTYGGSTLQEKAVRAATNSESILTIFPTGGGKSITFQLPALMAGENERGLTVVISPLQSLMKDQTDNLEQQHNVTNAVTINSSLDPIERAKAFERVEDGSASILYISPESLRSKSIERLLLGRNVVRFVIDEAHCFSSWGHDFRVDYLYIAEFIANLRAKKEMPKSIPVSCFTATAKPKVIEDIKEYFRKNLSLELKEFKADSARSNLNYHIIDKNEDEKGVILRELLLDNDAPAIVYVSRTYNAEKLAKSLSDMGLPALPYHGKMERHTRIENQEAFMSGQVDTIVATTAFGMGVDKKDVKMVIHYDISDSLESYVQEAGRAGRDESIQADCYILYSDEDLHKHFILLNQTKLTQKEIGQVWRAVKALIGKRQVTSFSPLEIARAAGWDDSVSEIETRAKTAISALERAHFIKRGQNMPRIYADSILVKNMTQAQAKIVKSARFDDKSREFAIRIIKNLISAKRKARGMDEDGESRVDYISDILGIDKRYVVRTIGLLREEKILSDAKDLFAYLGGKGSKNRCKNVFTTHMHIERFLLEYLSDEETVYNIKEMNEALYKLHSSSTIKQLQVMLNYFEIKHYINKIPLYGNNILKIKPHFSLGEMRSMSEKRFMVAGFIIDYLYQRTQIDEDHEEKNTVAFSVLELKQEFENTLYGEQIELEDVEDAIYYLIKISALRIDGGFLVLYSAMEIERLEKSNKAQYKKEDYTELERHYNNKRQQIHIVGEYARFLLDDLEKAKEYVKDYFELEYEKFLRKYFKGRLGEINLNITPKKFDQLFGSLSPAQLEIIKDHKNRRIVVAAGPGSGKTMLLTHKLASLCIMEDVKHEQMLMVTFSRAAATEFKKRLMNLIGNAVRFIQIMTFHSYCFDLLGRVGSKEKSDEIIMEAVEKIKQGEIDISRLTKTVLVIDEAQDMSQAEYNLVKSLMEINENMQIIAVGDDDQNVYEFRGASSIHFGSFMNEPDSKKYELVDNYRSRANIVLFANQFAQTISNRFKTVPIIPVSKENGSISICKLTSKNIEIPVVNAILNAKPAGSTCIITRGNNEAQNVAGLLIQNGIAARLIQTNEGFNLSKLVELRDFLSYVDVEEDAYTISDDAWANAITKLSVKYGASSDINNVLKLLDNFDDINKSVKYKSELQQFIRESKLEDFITGAEGTVLVSTIHKAKGREFDNVYLALSASYLREDAEKRGVYVALTRAKENLCIFANGAYFDRISSEGIARSVDSNNYPEPSIISLQLSHKDVDLGNFCKFQKNIDTLVSGQKLDVDESGCYIGGNNVIKFSEKSKENFRKKINELKSKGYIPITATIRHILFWQGKDCDNEIKIILPSIEFLKEK